MGFSGWLETRWHRGARTSVHERLRASREITRVYECLVWVGFAGLSETGFAGFLGISGWRGPCWHECLLVRAWAMLARVRSFERWTRDCERLREIMSVCVCLRALGGLFGAGFAGFFGILRMGEDLLTQVGSYERWTRDCERLREIMSVCVCLRVLGGLSGAGSAGFFGIFGMAWAMLARVRSFERLQALYERSREITSVHESLWQVF